MDFYHVLSMYYDDIFPLREPQRRFLHAYLEQEQLSSLLDVGCGTGTMALEASTSGTEVVGVDLSPDMIEIARNKARERLSSASFEIADMRDLSHIPKTFDSIFCLGNTLAHVSDVSELHRVFTQFRKKGSRLLLQTVNYDRVLARHIEALPIIQTPHLTFYRYYTHRVDGKIDFFMKIELPNDQPVISGVNLLLPVTSTLLKTGLQETGWVLTGIWGNFENDPWSVDSPATVMAAKRISS